MYRSFALLDATNLHLTRGKEWNSQCAHFVKCCKHIFHSLQMHGRRNKWRGSVVPNPSPLISKNLQFRKYAHDDVPAEFYNGLVVEAALLCEPGPHHLSHAFHFAPRVPNMLCSSSRSGMILYATTRCAPSARRLPLGAQTSPGKIDRRDSRSINNEDFLPLQPNTETTSSNPRTEKYPT